MPFGISVNLQTNPISTPHARVTEWRDVMTKRATLLTTQTWSRSRPLSWGDAIGRFWRQVVAIYRGRIELDHTCGLRCRGLYCHFGHSTRRTGRKRPRDGRSHSCCAGGGSTNHSSADRIVVNSYSTSYGYAQGSISDIIILSTFIWSFFISNCFPYICLDVLQVDLKDMVIV